MHVPSCLSVVCIVSLLCNHLQAFRPSNPAETLSELHHLKHLVFSLHMLGDILPCECPSLVTLVSVWQAISDWAKSKTLQQQRQFLPVFDCREELLQVIRENQVVVVVGETGSGKTTQVCFLSYKGGYTLNSPFTLSTCSP